MNGWKRDTNTDTTITKIVNVGTGTVITKIEKKLPTELDFPYLSPAELERLAVLAEECGEVVQAVNKIIRHGYNNHHPARTETNREELMTELGHILFAIGLLAKGKDVQMHKIECSQRRKSASAKKYLHHQKEII